MKSFDYWKRQEVAEEFGLQEVYEHPILEKWLKTKCEISEDIKSQLKSLQRLLFKMILLFFIKYFSLIN